MYGDQIIIINNQINKFFNCMESYPFIFRIYYRKVIAGHSRKILLLKKMHVLLENIDLMVGLEDIPMELDRGQKQQEHSQSLRENQGLKNLLHQEGLQWSCQWVFVSQLFRKVIVFSVLSILIANQNTLKFKLIEQKLTHLLEESRLQQQTLNAIRFEWSIIGQVLINKKILQWQKILSDSVDKFPLEFMQLFCQIFYKEMEGQLNEQAAGKLFQSISLQLKIKINYFQIEGRRLLKCQRHGLGEEVVYIGYLHDVSRYAIPNRIPVLSETAYVKQKALDQIRIHVKDLAQQYEEGSCKIKELINLASFRWKQDKIASYLQTRF